MADRQIEHQWVPQNDDERFDHVEVTSVERWKESELSGDEWRFTFVARFYSHGVEVMTRYGASIEDCLVSAAHWFRHPRHQDEHPETTAEWTVALAEVKERCAQPGCREFWTVLYHPVKKFLRDGTAAGVHWDDRQKLADGEPCLGWLAVRGFCDRHRHRGDCDLEDNDDNYELILERVSPAWVTEEATDD